MTHYESAQNTSYMFCYFTVLTDSFVTVLHIGQTNLLSKTCSLTFYNDLF